MHSKSPSLNSLDTNALSLALGLILLLSLVVISTTMVSSVILSHDQPETQPDADVRFEQQANINTASTNTVKSKSIPDDGSISPPNIALASSDTYSAVNLSEHSEPNDPPNSLSSTQGSGILYSHNQESQINNSSTFRVLDASLNKSHAVTGRPVRMSVVIDNTGVDSETAYLQLTSNKSASTTIQPATFPVTVEPGDQVRYEYTLTFDETGTYNLSLSNTGISKQIEIHSKSSTVYDGNIQSAVEDQTISKVITSYKDEINNSDNPAYNPSIPPVVQGSNGTFVNDAEGIVYDFGQAQDSQNNAALTLEGNQTTDELKVGLAFENVPEQNHYTVQLNYNITVGPNVQMKVVRRDGTTIDPNTKYMLDSENDQFKTKYFTLSKEESDYIQDHKNIYLVFTANGVPVVDINYMRGISSENILDTTSASTEFTDFRVENSAGAETSEFNIYEPIYIDVVKQNTGTSVITEEVRIEENGNIIDSKTVRYNPGEKKTITFIKYKPEGVYTYSSRNYDATTVTVGNPTQDSNKAPIPKMSSTAPEIQNKYVPSGQKVGDDRVAPIELNASESYDPNGDNITFTWKVDGTQVGTGPTINESAFSTNGTKTVALIVEDEHGNKSAIRRKVSINRIKPTALFEVNPTPIPTGTTAEFNASDALDQDGEIRRYIWEVNGVTVANKTEDPYALQEFNSTGDYQITLTTVDDDGNRQSRSTTVTVFDADVVADYDYTPAEPRVGEEVSFDGSDSQADNATIESYTWTLSDGTVIGTGETITKSFDNDGEVSVELTVETSDGKTANTTQTITVQPPFEAVANADPEEALPGETIYFDAYSSNDTQNLIENYSWELGDGTTASGQEVFHEYDDPGTYQATLTVSGNGYQDSDTVTVNITEGDPVAITQPDNLSVFLAEGADLYGDDSYHPSATITYYHWELGDGGTVDKDNVIDYNYTEPTVNVKNGTITKRHRQKFNATLTVTDEYGNTDKNGTLVEVRNRGPHNEYKVETDGDSRNNTTNSDYNEWVSSNFTFNGTPSYHRESPIGNIETYKWTFTRPDGTSYTRYGEVVTENFSQIGEYTVEYDIKDQYGYWNNTSFTMDIDARDPKASFTYSPEEPGPSEPVDYDGSSSAHDEPQGKIQSYEWNFDDGSGNKTGEKVTHTFSGSNSQTYNVTLTVTDQWGQTSSVTKQIMTDPYQSCHELLINRQDASSGYYPIDPDDDGSGTFEVYCEMDYDGGGWTVIDKQTMWDFAQDTSYSLTLSGDIQQYGVGPDDVWSADGGGDHSFVYRVDTGFSYKEVRVVNYKLGATSYRVGGSTSEMRGDNTALKDWDGLNSGGISGDGAFGTGSTVLDSYSNAYNGQCTSGSNQDWPTCDAYHGTSNIYTPPDGTPYFWDNGDSYQVEGNNTIAVGWGEAGGQEEGWEWEAGEFWIRQPVGTFIYFYDNGANNKNFYEVQSQNGYTDFQSDQVVLQTDGGQTTIHNGDNINLSRYNKIYVDYVLTKDGGTSGSVILNVNGQTKNDTITESYLVNDGSLEIDASGMSGNGTVNVTAESVGGANTTLEVARIWGREGGVQETTTLYQEGFSGGTAGWESDTGSITTTSGWLTTQCSSSYNTQRLNRSFGPSLDASTIDYTIQLAAIDSWDGETLTFQIRDDSGWTTVNSTTVDHSNTPEDDEPYDCADGTWGGKEIKWSGSFTVDGQIHEVKVTAGTDQTDNDESVGIDSIVIERTS